ncbi:MAG: ROK family transcriptional regulator [Candidatus Omnitrophica bacterium]|nr:ROK family transcriptional regulator [Candidatus Omnitrophota bacterium]
MLSEQERKRDQNRYQILKTLHFRGPLQRFELANLCDIRKSSITSIVNELVDLDLVRPQDYQRKRSPLILDDTRRYAAAVSLSPSLVRVAKVSLTGTFQRINEKTVPEGTGLRKLLNIAVEMLKKEFRGKIKKAIGIGISCPGLIDSSKGVCLQAANIPDSQNMPIRNFFKKHFALPLHVENDVRCSLWASVWFEQFLKDFQNVFYVEITHGVGSALLINGTIIEGAHFTAGEFGHIKAGDNGQNCLCGKKDCLETYCNIPAISKAIRQISPAYRDVYSAGDIARCANGNKRVTNVLDKAVGRMVKILAPLIASLDPQALVLGNQEPLFYNTIIPFLHKHMLSEHKAMAQFGPQIFIAKSGKDASLKGIAGLVIEDYFKKINDK